MGVRSIFSLSQRVCYTTTAIPRRAKVKEDKKAGPFSQMHFPIQKYNVIVCTTYLVLTVPTIEKTMGVTKNVRPGQGL